MPLVSGAVTRSTAPAMYAMAVDRWTPNDGTTYSSSNGFGYSGSGPHPLAGALGGAAYDSIYGCHLWPAVCVNKLTALQMQLPGKVYQRRRRGRQPAAQSPFGRLMANPSPVINPVAFWTWFTAMFHIHGRSFAVKGRDAGGRPVALALIHPTRMRYGPPNGGHADAGAVGLEQGGNRWWFRLQNGTEIDVPRSEFIYWGSFSPASPMGGMSRLEPLRESLELESAALVANKALLQRGGKHDIVLKTPKNFGNGTSRVLERLADQYQRRHGGVVNWGRPLILEDGMEAQQLNIPPKDLEYVSGRQLHREETAAAFDIPPTAIGILDHGTYSNVTELNRSLYRSTMPPHLQSFEAAVDFDLRDGRFGEDREPDFGEAFYFEWLVDGVLRGSPEERVGANAQAIQTGQMTPAEARELENRPFIEGSDRLFVNSAMVTIDAAAASEEMPPAVDRAAQSVGAPAPAGRLNRVGADGCGSAHARPGLPRQLTNEERSALMGRLGRLRSLDDLDERFVAGLDDDLAAAVLTLADSAEELGDLKQALRGAR